MLRFTLDAAYRCKLNGLYWLFEYSEEESDYIISRPVSVNMGGTLAEYNFVTANSPKTSLRELDYRSFLVGPIYDHYPRLVDVLRLNEI